MTRLHRRRAYDCNPMKTIQKYTPATKHRTDCVENFLCTIHLRYAAEKLIKRIYHIRFPVENTVFDSLPLELRPR